MQTTVINVLQPSGVLLNRMRMFGICYHGKMVCEYLNQQLKCTVFGA